MRARKSPSEVDVDANGEERSASTSTAPVIYFEPVRWRRRATRTLWEQLDAVFTNALPAQEVKDMPGRYKYTIGSVLLLCLGGIFTALFVTSFLSQQKQQFLSPLTGTTASSNCETVQVANSGKFQATRAGLWEGFRGFEYSEATYLFTLTNLQVSYESWGQIMWALYGELEYLESVLTKQDLAMNLLYWTSYARLPDTENQAQRFYVAGDPVAIFDRQHVHAALSSQAGLCNASSYASFDAANAQLRVTFPYEEYTQAPLCEDTIDPRFLGYLPGVNSAQFDVRIDVRSLITAMAVNLGVLSFEGMVEIATERGPYFFNGTEYLASHYYDPKYPGMKPLSCLTAGSTQLCAVQVGVVAAMPFFLHKGNDTQLPHRCLCEYISPEELADPYNECNLFSFLSGIVFWETVSVDPIFSLMLKYNYSMGTINDDLFNAAYISSYWGQESAHSAELQSAESFSRAFSFCDLPGLDEPCAMLTFSVFDSANFNWAVSSYYHQLRSGACNDTISPTKAAWEILVQNPFSPLLQEYQTCTNSPTTTAVTQFGIAVGNLGAATPVFIALFLSCLAFVQQYLGFSIPQRTYPREEKDAAEEALVLALLRERDRQTKQSERERERDKYSEGQRSVLRQLVEEITRENEMATYTGSEKIVSPLQQKREFAVEMTAANNVSETSSVQSASTSATASSTLLVLNAIGSSSSSSFAVNAAAMSEEERRKALRRLKEDFLAQYVVRFQGDSNQASSQALYWSSVRETAMLSQWSFAQLCEDAEMLADLAQLMRAHTCLHMSCREDVCESKFGGAVGYRFRDGVKSLSEVLLLHQDDV